MNCVNHLYLLNSKGINYKIALKYQRIMNRASPKQIKLVSEAKIC